MRFLTLLIASFIITSYLSAQTNQTENNQVQSGINYIKQFTEQQSYWFFEDHKLNKTVKGLLHFLEDDNIDTILVKLQNFHQQHDSLFIFRNPEDVDDTLNVPGFYRHSTILEKKKQLNREIRDQVSLESIPIPEFLLTGLEQKVAFISKENAEQLIRDSVFIVPDSLGLPDIPIDSLHVRPKKLREYQYADSIKNILLEQARIAYNDSLLRFYIDSISQDYRTKALTYFSDSLQNRLVDSLNYQNKRNIAHYNDSVVAAVNDSIRKVLLVLESEAEKDSIDVWIHNFHDDSTRVWLRNNDDHFTKMFIKNEQDDSLGVLIQNLSKNAMKILVQDGVSFSRFQEKQKREIKFESFDPNQDLVAVKHKFKVITPWNMGINSNLGFTQTALSNWKKGGKSSLSTLAIIKAFANYSNKKIKWENDLEIRNGWTQLSDDDDKNNLQKSSDKFGFTSRFGISAFKKWYYSAEFDFETQFFNGYKYPDTDNPISAFMAPARTFIKLGLDYKPNKNFSVFISPLTSKTVFVRDTVLIDQTKFGISKDKRRFWEPGLNADLKFKTKIIDDIIWETKYKMFINYKQPFEKFDVNWENQISMKVNDYINVNFMLHLIYDDNVLFETDKIDPETGQNIKEAKWQVKELITVGFAYKINKQVKKRQKVN